MKITTRDEKIIDTIYRLAEDFDSESSANVVSCIALGNKIIAYGFCAKKSHPLQARFGRNEDSIYLHSEIDAIKNAVKRVSVDDLRKATIYVARAKKHQYRYRRYNIVRGLARPCEGCMRAIRSFNLRYICYTTDSDEIIKESVHDD